MTSIEAYASRDCSSLTSVVIQDSVASIGTYVFSYCYFLASVTIGSGVEASGNTLLTIARVLPA
jgi:hypothetical protein